jgi:hypothetical protein
MEIEPVEWFVVFHRKSMNRLLGWLAMGEFKHVSAFGYCAGFKCWLIYDVTWSGTRIKLLPHNEFGKAAISLWTQDCYIMKLPRGDAVPHLTSRIGFYCVSAVKHLIGLRCVAATPSQLYRHILHHGGTLVSGPRPAPTATAGPEPRR